MSRYTWRRRTSYRDTWVSWSWHVLGRIMDFFATTSPQWTLKEVNLSRKLSYKWKYTSMATLRCLFLLPPTMSLHRSNQYRFLHADMKVHIHFIAAMDVSVDERLCRIIIYVLDGHVSTWAIIIVFPNTHKHHSRRSGYIFITLVTPSLFTTSACKSEPH